MSEHARSVAAVLLAGLLLVGAGCSGVPGTDSGDGGGDPYTAAGEPLNASQLSVDHAGALRSAGSYSAQVNFTVSNDTAVQLFANQTMQVDVEADEGLVEAHTKFFGVNHRTAYTQGDTTWERTVTPGFGSSEPQYAMATAPYEGSVQPVNTTVGEGELEVDAFEWEHAGTESGDGTTLTRYEVTGVSNASDLPSVGDSGDRSVQDVEGYVLVTSEGMVHEFDVGFTLPPGEDAEEPAHYHLFFEFYDVGSTSVEKPSWTSKAE